VANGLRGSETTSGLFVTTARDSDEYRGGGLFSRAAVGDRGAALQLQATVTSLAIESQGIPLQQRRERIQLRYSHPLLDSYERELSFRLGFDAENLDVVQDSLISREERLRSVEPGIQLNHRSANGQQLIGLDLEQGLRGFGSRIDHFLSAVDAPDTDFTILRLRYVYVRRLSDTLSLRWDVLGQHSQDVLPSIKRFKVGGGRIGRGFEAAAASGDRGIGNKLELKRRVGDTIGWIGRTDLYGYYDLGTTWRNDAPGRESASSAGIGVAWTADRLSGYLEFAQPLTHADVDGQDDVSAFAELSFRF
jgi:hemolysin activation/secretion protein